VLLIELVDPLLDQADIARLDATTIFDDVEVDYIPSLQAEMLWLELETYIPACLGTDYAFTPIEAKPGNPALHSYSPRPPCDFSDMTTEWMADVTR
jgi:hypothetical protein